MNFLCVSVCLSLFIYIYIYIRAFMCMYVSVCVCMCARGYLYACVYVYAHFCVCMCVRLLLFPRVQSRKTRCAEWPSPPSPRSYYSKDSGRSASFPFATIISIRCVNISFSLERTCSFLCVLPIVVVVVVSLLPSLLQNVRLSSLAFYLFIYLF